ncbi:MAG: hemolysin family protein, partial [Akkermansia muciniphila]
SQILKTPRLQDRYIATAQLGVTFASLGLGMYGEHAVAGWLHEWLAQYGWASWLVAHGAASILSVAVLTYLHIVLGEMVPKALSLQYAAKLCLIIAMPMYVIQLCLYPLVVGMNALGNFFLGLLGVDRNESKSHYHSAEELQYIIEESHENGALPQESGRIMDGLFDLDDLYVHQVMTPRVRIDAIPEGAEHEQIREIVRRTRRTRYPVYRGDLDHVVGMVHARDLFRIMFRRKALTPEYIHAIPKVPKTVKFDNVVEIMRKDNVRLAIILDEHGGTSGLLTLTDVFSEVMGWDRGRIKVLTELPRDAVGFSCDVSGLARIEELGEAMDMDLEDGEIDTVGGLILNLLEAPAEKGDTVGYRGLEFKVTRTENGGVERCTVTRITTLMRE